MPPRVDTLRDPLTGSAMASTPIQRIKASGGGLMKGARLYQSTAHAVPGGLVWYQKGDKVDRGSNVDRAGTSPHWAESGGKRFLLVTKQGEAQQRLVGKDRLTGAPPDPVHGVNAWIMRRGGALTIFNEAAPGTVAAQKAEFEKLRSDNGALAVEIDLSIEEGVSFDAFQMGFQQLKQADMRRRADAVAQNTLHPTVPKPRSHGRATTLVHAHPSGGPPVPPAPDAPASARLNAMLATASGTGSPSSHWVSAQGPAADPTHTPAPPVSVSPPRPHPTPTTTAASSAPFLVRRNPPQPGSQQSTVSVTQSPARFALDLSSDKPPAMSLARPSSGRRPPREKVPVVTATTSAAAVPDELPPPMRATTASSSVAPTPSVRERMMREGVLGAPDAWVPGTPVMAPKTALWKRVQGAFAIGAFRQLQREQLGAQETAIQDNAGVVGTGADAAKAAAARTEAQLDGEQGIRKFLDGTCGGDWFRAVAMYKRFAANAKKPAEEQQDGPSLSVDGMTRLLNYRDYATVSKSNPRSTLKQTAKLLDARLAALGMPAETRRPFDWYAPGSTEPTSDIDVTLIGDGTELAVPIANTLFRKEFKREPGVYFDVNFYAENFMPTLSAKGLAEKMTVATGETKQSKGRDTLPPGSFPVTLQTPGAMAEDSDEEAVYAAAQVMKGVDGDVELWGRYRKSRELGANDDGRTAALLDKAEGVWRARQEAVAQQKEVNRRSTLPSFEGAQDEASRTLDAQMWAEDELYEQQLSKLFDLRQALEAAQSAGKPAPELDRIRRSIRTATHESMLYANEAYHTDAAVVGVVANKQILSQQFDLGRDKYTARSDKGPAPKTHRIALTPAEHHDMFTEQVGRILLEVKHLEHGGSVDMEKVLIKVGKYLHRAMNAAKHLERAVGSDKDTSKTHREAAVAWVEKKKGLVRKPGGAAPAEDTWGTSTEQLRATLMFWVTENARLLSTWKKAQH